MLPIHLHVGELHARTFVENYWYAVVAHLDLTLLLEEGLSGLIEVCLHSQNTLLFA